MTASERGWISDLVNLNLVTSTVVLSCPPRGGFTPTEESFPFSIPFPSYVNGGASSLPPSYASWSPGFLSEVEYCVRVDIHRKGLRRHELYVLFALYHSCAVDTRASRRIIPIMYLPKTRPSHPIPSRISTFGLHPDSILYETASLPPVWPKDVCPKANAMIPTVEASFTVTCIYTYPFSHRILVVLSVQCHVFFRTFHSLKAYHQECGGSCSGAAPHQRVGSPVSEAHGSAVPYWSGG